MTISKTKTFNTFDFRGLTRGKIIAIQNAFREQEKAGTLTTLGKEILTTIDNFEKTEEKKAILNSQKIELDYDLEDDLENEELDKTMDKCRNENF